jgi:GNAT superfamily N-acetyltransferase
MHTIVIEKAVPEDVEWIAEFQIEMAMESESFKLDPDTVRRGVRKIFDEPSFGFYVSAKDEHGTPVGCLLLQREWSDWRNAEAWWIHSVYVIPPVRCQGVFTRMFDWAAALAKDSGIFCLRLYLDRGNKPARAVYERIGMDNRHYEMFETMLSCWTLKERDA